MFVPMKGMEETIKEIIKRNAIMLKPGPVARLVWASQLIEKWEVIKFMI
jgi:hypothetical protein